MSDRPSPLGDISWDGPGIDWSEERDVIAENEASGFYGRCRRVDNGGDTHARPHECKSPLKADGTCPWHGTATE